jgi:hypothetical protein
MWRGSVNMKLKFVKTQYHTGRLQITFTPGITVTTVPTTTNSLYSLRTIVDIRDQDTIELNLPYLIASDYLNIARTGIFESGLLTIHVLTDLKAPETCAQSIKMMVTFTGGDDLEYAAPSANVLNAGPFIPQSGGGTGMLVSAGIADSTVMPTSLLKARKCTGELFTSVKQILNRVMPVNNSTATPFINATAVDIDPYFVGSMSNNAAGTVSYAQTFNDGYSVIAHMYAYFKGGMKVSIAHSGNSYATAAYFQNGGATAAFSSVGITVSNTQDLLSQPYGGAILPFTGTYVHDSAVASSYVQVPYAASTPVSFVSRYAGTARAGPAQYNYPRGRINVCAIGGATNLNKNLLARGCLDDFQFCCFLGCPPALISIA